MVTVSLQCFMRKAWFRCFSSFLLITHLITLSLEKIVIVCEKNLEKVLNFGSKSLFDTCDSDLFLHPVLLESLFIYKQHLSEIIWIKKTQLTFLFHCKEIWMQCRKAGYHSSCILPFKQSCVTEVWRQVTMEAKFSDHNNGALAATTATATRTTGKNNSLRLAKQQLCTGIKLFYIS